MDKIGELIDQTNGRAFLIRFVKNDGEERTMRCRTGVRKHLVPGGRRAYDPAQHGLRFVFDFDRRAYRACPADEERVLEFKCGDVHWIRAGAVAADSW